MPTKDYEKIRNAAVYMDGKPIKRIQEIELPEMRIQRESAIGRIIKLIKSEIFIIMFKLRNGRKGR